MTDRTTDADARGPTAESGFDRRLVPPVVLGSIPNPVNSTVIAVALVPIGTAFWAPPARTAWLVSALCLATALGQPIAGRLVDLFGPRRLFLLSTGLVGVAGPLAPGLGALIAARVLLGFGTCAGHPAAMALPRGEAERTGQDDSAGILTTPAVATGGIVLSPRCGRPTWTTASPYCPTPPFRPSPAPRSGVRIGPARPVPSPPRPGTRG